MSPSGPIPYRFWPLTQGGVKIAIFAIVPKRGMRLFSPLGHIFWGVFIVGWHFSRTAAFMSAASAAVDTFSPISCSHTWCVHSSRWTHLSHILDIVFSRSSPPACHQHCRGCPCVLVFLCGIDPPLDQSTWVPFMQVSLDHLGPPHTYKSRAFLRVYGQ